MKKFILGLSLTFAVMSATTILQAQTIPVYFNSKPITLKQNPIIENGTTLVPLRGVFETLGFQVGWDPTTGTIDGHKGDLDITLQIGNTNATVNGENKKLAVAPKIVNGNTMVPLRFVSEAAGYDVDWNSKSKYITVGEKDQELIDVYESVDVITSNNDVVTLRVSDLYTVDGNGSYAGFKKIVGHPYSGYDIYYQGGNGSALEVRTVDKNYNPNEIVTWTYQGVTSKTTKQKAYETLNSLPTKFINSGEAKQIFGNTFTQWFNSGVVREDGYRIVQRYLDKQNGFRFKRLYDDYLVQNSSKIMAEQKAKEAEEQKALEQQNAIDQLEQQEKAVAQKSEWISERELKNSYNVGASWLGERIIITKNDGENFTITGSPKGQFEIGKIYEGNGIKYQYSTDHDDIVFYVSDLENAGIIE